MNFQQPSISARVMPVKMGKEKPMMGGKWEVVKEFSGKSHKDGGIDIEVGNGYVRHINASSEKPDVIAKNGRVWKDIGAAAYGAGGGEGGPIMFRQQPLAQEAAFNYLSRYGINT